MKIFKPIVIKILGLSFLAAFFGIFFLLLNYVENKAAKQPLNTEVPNINKKDNNKNLQQPRGEQ